jgi:hypothetical protein
MGYKSRNQDSAQGSTKFRFSYWIKLRGWMPVANALATEIPLFHAEVARRKAA